MWCGVVWLVGGGRAIAEKGSIVVSPRELVPCTGEEVHRLECIDLVPKD